LVAGGFIGLFNSSIAPHQTAVQMSTRETLLDMKNTIVRYNRTIPDPCTEKITRRNPGAKVVTIYYTGWGCIRGVLRNR
jgi:hypothetical protein